MRHAVVVIAQKILQQAACRRYLGVEATLIPNGYKAPHDSAAQEDGPVLWVAVIRKGKRPDLFLALAEQLPHVRFRMIGGRLTTGLEDRLFVESASEPPSCPMSSF